MFVGGGGYFLLGPKLSQISELISRTDRGRTNDIIYLLMFSLSFKNRWWLSGIGLRLLFFILFFVLFLRNLSTSTA